MSLVPRGLRNRFDQFRHFDVVVEGQEGLPVTPLGYILPL